MSFKSPFPISTINDFSQLIYYKEDAKYKPAIAVKAPDCNPLIILQTMTDYYKEIVDFLVAIGEPKVRTKNYHEYELNVFSLYSASSMGFETYDIIQMLDNISKNYLQQELKDYIIENTKTYGIARLMLKNKRYFIKCKNEEVLNKIRNIQEVYSSHQTILQKYNQRMQIEENINTNNEEGDILPEGKNYIEIDAKNFGSVRNACERAKYPLLEEFSFKEDKGNILNITPKFKSPVRAYQEKALNIMCSNGIARSGIIVLPCGAGKTLVGILAICTIKRNTIIICNNIVAVEQWYREINQWVNIARNDNNNNNNEKNTFVCRFTSNKSQRDQLWNLEKESGILITSYSMISHSEERRSEEVKLIMSKLKDVDWGLMIIDEVQLLPAKNFSKIIKENFKSHCKLGLTATLVREDEGIKDLHFLIGPKLYEANWLDLQKDGFLARVKCIEIWSEMHPMFYEQYLKTDLEYNYKKLLYVSNPTKYFVTLMLLEKHKGDKIIIFSDSLFTIRQYEAFLNEKRMIDNSINFKMIDGNKRPKEREAILEDFRTETGINILLMTKVGDISIDIPNANVIIQISSHYGSRMQEAQRFGRILRPKKDAFSEYNAFFYTIVSKNTEEMIFSNKRHRFLVDQGYYFNIINDIRFLLDNKNDIEKFEKDISYKNYVKDTYKKAKNIINNEKNIENDLDDGKDAFEILQNYENSTDEYEF